MADETQKSPSRLWRIVLVLSLALNVAVLGIVGGAVFRDKVKDQPPSRMEFGAGPLGRALSPEDRREISRAIRERVDFEQDGRPSPRRTIREIQDVLRQEPFDQARFEEVLDRTVRRASQAQAAAQEALVERISAMTSEERVAFADRLSQSMKKR